MSFKQSNYKAELSGLKIDQMKEEGSEKSIKVVNSQLRINLI